jgi:glucokinase
MYPRLVGDIGGTNARFGLVLESAPTVVSHVHTVPVASQPSVHAALVAYLRGAQAHVPRILSQLQCAAIAVATPVLGDEVKFTNSAWSFSQRELMQALSLKQLMVMNDFEALALSLPRLSNLQLQWLANIAPRQGVKAVVGPGTGLGVGTALPVGDRWVALPGEGGHASIAPANAYEADILKALWPKFPHVSAERLLSGTGLPTLYAGVAAVMGKPARALNGREIVEAGLARECDVCHEVIDVFCAMLGGVCGNVALTTGAQGGVYLGGGIVPRLGARFFGSTFRERFEAKGRFQPYLARIATPVITDTFAALNGAALALDQAQT